MSKSSAPLSASPTLAPPRRELGEDWNSAAPGEAAPTHPAGLLGDGPASGASEAGPTAKGVPIDDVLPRRRECEADLYVRRVEERLQEYLDGHRGLWEGRYPQLAHGFDAVESFVLNGGKRMRPRFAFWGHRGAGGDPDDPRLLDLGAAIELFHAFALIHDDVMDDSAVRRHQPTLQHRFGALHQWRGWAGEERRVGEGFAILLGDLAFAYSSQLLATMPRSVVDLFDTTRIELHVGQYLDLMCATGDGTDEAVMADVALLKTARYSVERPLQLGSALAGYRHLDSTWTEYGLAVGEAFQHRDDLLGVFGDPATTGKPVGDDLRSGKATMLLYRTQRAPGAERVDALGRIGSAAFDPADVAVVAAFMQDCGAVTAVEDRISSLIDNAEHCLAAAPLDRVTRQGLQTMASAAAWRNT